ncbi:Hypothetical_protein [Hexamita inflata]|uniref:Hypothetical_protein n=1 Tax=Hexamita inflata TaxID=28002 RepID=A0ABP1JG19_9EUKA
MDILNEWLFQNKAESLPNSSKSQQLPKKLNSNNQVSKLEYSVEQIKSLINTRAFTGYSIVDAKKAEKQLSVIPFASKAKARDVLHAKTTLRNTRSSPDSYCCCYYQKHKRYRILQQIQEEREAILKLKKYEQLDSIFGVDQEINQPKNKKAEGKQDPNTPCKKTRRSFKNKCSKACAIVLIKGNTLIKTKSRYIDRFHYVVDDGDIQNQIGQKVVYQKQMKLLINTYPDQNLIIKLNNQQIEKLKSNISKFNLICNVICIRNIIYL